MKFWISDLLPPIQIIFKFVLLKLQFRLFLPFIISAYTVDANPHIDPTFFQHPLARLQILSRQ